MSGVRLRSAPSRRPRPMSIATTGMTTSMYEERQKPAHFVRDKSCTCFILLSLNQLLLWFIFARFVLITFGFFGFDLFTWFCKNDVKYFYCIFTLNNSPTDLFSILISYILWSYFNRAVWIHLRTVPNGLRKVIVAEIQSWWFTVKNLVALVASDLVRISKLHPIVLQQEVWNWP